MAAAWRCGSSMSRSLMASARASSLRTSPPRLLRPPPPASPLRDPLPRRRLSFASNAIRSPAAELGCVQSLLPLHSVVAAARLTSHLSVNARACCELSQGTFCRTCQDR